MTTSPVWVVVPCYNEAKRLDVDEFVRLSSAIEAVLFVDDGSTDSTETILRRLADEHDSIHLDRFARNGGKAEAVRAGLLRAIDAGADVVGYLDADLATPVDEYLRLVDRMAGPDSPDGVIGSRVQLLGHAIHRNSVRHYLGRLYATAASMAVGAGVYDTQCGAKLFRVDDVLDRALRIPFADRWSFDAELISRLLTPSTSSGAESRKIVEVPLTRWNDVAGSKLGIVPSLRAAWSLIGVARRRGTRQHD